MIAPEVVGVCNRFLSNFMRLVRKKRTTILWDAKESLVPY